MGALFDIAHQMEPWLLERGLTRDDIATGMELLFGDDWRSTNAPDLVKRLRKSGYKITGAMPAFADELEALIRGAIKLESIRKQLIIY